MKTFALHFIGTAAFTCSVLTPSADSQSFDYQDFSSVSGIAFNGDAHQAANVLRVTPALFAQVGSAYHQQPVRVADGFDTTFEFRIANAESGGADGMAFVIQNDIRGLTALGSPGGEMGYGAYPWLPASGAIRNSLVVEFDTWRSSPEGDLSGNEVSIHTNSTLPNENDEDFSLGHVSPSIFLSDGLVHLARINYDGVTLSVYLDDLFTPLLSVPYSFDHGGQWIGGGAVGGLNLQLDGAAYVGFSAGTSDGLEDHDVLSWRWDSDAGPGTAYCFGDVAGSLCPCGNQSTSEGGCANSSGLGAVLSATGSASITSSNLGLVASQLPAHKPGLFLQSDVFANGGNGSLFGDGLRCVGSSTTYLEVVFSNGSGLAASGTNLILVGGASAGQSKSFQYWFRDPSGPCGSGVGATNGLRVLFNP